MEQDERSLYEEYDLWKNLEKMNSDVAKSTSSLHLCFFKNAEIGALSDTFFMKQIKNKRK